ncbi:MAG: VOC family protein [Candidatus Levybacteria bacterium]|nr:VOC family protein [Candidatus Levybacteria bacterium]
MVKGIESIMFFSEDADALSEFYKEKVGLEVDFEGEMGEKNESVYIFKIKDGSGFGIMGHSKVKGKNKEPERIMINFEVDDIEKEVKKLHDAGVKRIQNIYHVEDYGLIATFEDIDGNYFQLVQVKESE